MACGSSSGQTLPMKRWCPIVTSSVGVLGGTHVSPLDALLAFLRSRAILLVLDNCEYVIDACANLAEQLLSACPDHRILATSRFRSRSNSNGGEGLWRYPTPETSPGRMRSRAARRFASSWTGPR